MLEIDPCHLDPTLLSDTQYNRTCVPLSVHPHSHTLRSYKWEGGHTGYCAQRHKASIYNCEVGAQHRYACERGKVISAVGLSIAMFGWEVR